MRQEMSKHQLLTTTQAGEVIGVKQRRVLQMIATGELPAIKPGNAFLVKRKDAEAVVRRPPGRVPRAEGRRAAAATSPNRGIARVNAEGEDDQSEHRRQASTAE